MADDPSKAKSFPPSEETLRVLREALQVSPNNLPLRQHLADVLLHLGRSEEAEEEYRQALSLSPDHSELKLGLAKAFYNQGKDPQALVIVEDFLQRKEIPAKALVLHARLLLRSGQVEQAVQQYRKAIGHDPSLEDQELSERLGVDSGNPQSEVVEGKIRLGAEGSPLSFEALVEQPSVTFKDVGGMEEIKEEIKMKIIYPLLHPDLYKAYGKQVGGGILLYGPPGCGKSYLARATAGEIKAGFIVVGIHEILDMWLGVSERNLHEMFEQARRNKPCVLFFDEVDALGASRSDMRHSAGRQVINQFLTEMDGLGSSNEGILILAATNAPWHMDAAFLRPGRFDQILFVPPPDPPARAAVLRIHCHGKPVHDIDYEHIAKKADQFSGADLKAAVSVAVEKKLRQAMQEGTPTPISSKDLLAAVETVRPSTKEWFSTARNYAVYSNQSGLFDPILKYLKL